MLHGVLESNCG